jgi:predicted secreted protein
VTAVGVVSSFAAPGVVRAAPAAASISRETVGAAFAQTVMSSPVLETVKLRRTEDVIAELTVSDNYLDGCVAAIGQSEDRLAGFVEADAPERLNIVRKILTTAIVRCSDEERIRAFQIDALAGMVTGCAIPAETPISIASSQL